VPTFRRSLVRPAPAVRVQIAPPAPTIVLLQFTAVIVGALRRRTADLAVD
jgi:hypothetical protein